MKNFTPDDYSQIFGPDEKPTRRGWYVASPFKIEYSLSSNFNGIMDYMFDYWDGVRWLNKPNGFAFTKQNRYWFGLREKP